MKDKESISGLVLEIIEKYAFDKTLVKNATSESRIITDLKINSARIVDIILDIEDSFNIEVDDASVERMIRVQDAVDIIYNQINEK